MKKIAIFQTDLNIGGIQKSLVNFLNNIDNHEYEIDLYLFNKDNIYIKDIPKNINIFYLKKLPYVARFIYFDILKLITTNKIKKEYDIAIDFNTYSMDTSISCIKVKADKKITWIHNDVKIKEIEEPKFKILLHFFKGKYKYFDKFVAVSNGALNSFIDNLKIKNKEYVVIPNIIDTNEINRKRKEKIDFKVDDNKINICSVGRLIHQKGFDILIDEIDKLVKIRKDIHLYIIGDGVEKDKLQLKIDELELNDYITLLGYKENPFPYMNKMDAFALTSRYEGQGMVVLEAKSLGLDIIVSKNLEKYIDDVVGSDDVSKSLSKLKKHDKKFNELSSYNDSIIKSLMEL